MINNFKKFMETMKNTKPFYMSILVKQDNDQITTVTFDKNDINNIIEDFDKTTIPQKQVLIENFQEFVDPEICSEHWDELLDIFEDNANFNNMFDYYCGVFDSFKANDNYNLSNYNLNNLTKTIYINKKRIVVKVDVDVKNYISDKDLSNLILIFEVYNNE